MDLSSAQTKIKSELAKAIKTNDMEKIESVLWEALILFQRYPFTTIKGLQFTYTIKGYEMFVNRKEKSITRSTISMSLKKVMELDYKVIGPKKIGTFGASYIYSIFKALAVIE